MNLSESNVDYNASMSPSLMQIVLNNLNGDILDLPWQYIYT